MLPAIKKFSISFAIMRLILSFSDFVHILLKPSTLFMPASPSLHSSKTSNHSLSECTITYETSKNRQTRPHFQFKSFGGLKFTSISMETLFIQDQFMYTVRTLNPIISARLMTSTASIMSAAAQVSLTRALSASRFP